MISKWRPSWICHLQFLAFSATFKTRLSWTKSNKNQQKNTLMTKNAKVSKYSNFFFKIVKFNILRKLPSKQRQRQP